MRPPSPSCGWSACGSASRSSAATTTSCSSAWSSCSSPRSCWPSAGSRISPRGASPRSCPCRSGHLYPECPNNRSPYPHRRVGKKQARHADTGLCWNLLEPATVPFVSESISASSERIELLERRIDRLRGELRRAATTGDRTYARTLRAELRRVEQDWDEALAQIEDQAPVVPRQPS